MADAKVDDWRKESAEVLQSLEARFPDFHCVRCQNDNFLMRVWHDSTLKPAFTDDRIVEYICDSCGLIERHVVAGLSGDMSAVKKRIKNG